MNEKTNSKFKVTAGVKFLDRSTGVTYAVRSVDSSAVLFGSAGGPKVSYGTCAISKFESQLANRVFEIVQ